MLYCEVVIECILAYCDVRLSLQDSVTFYTVTLVVSKNHFTFHTFRSNQRYFQITEIDHCKLQNANCTRRIVTTMS